MELEQLERRVLENEAMFSAALAKVHAMEYAVAALIQSHPEPSKSLAIWERIQLNPLDHAFDHPVPGYNEVLSERMREWTAGFLAAAGHL